MVNRRMKPAQLLALIRRLAREHGLTVTELPGRGKGSHRIFMLADSSGREVKRFGVTGHQRELSQTMMRQIEEGLADLFGQKWAEMRR